MNNLIRFETFQLVSFVLACSLFFFLFGRLMIWFIDRVKTKRPSIYARGRKE